MGENFMTMDEIDAHLKRRYQLDPTFHAAVQCYMQVSRQTGWRDEDGVWHHGPSVLVVREVAALESAWRNIGFPLASDSEGEGTQ